MGRNATNAIFLDFHLLPELYFTCSPVLLVSSPTILLSRIPPLSTATRCPQNINSMMQNQHCLCFAKPLLYLQPCLPNLPRKISHFLSTQKRSLPFPVFP